MDLNERKRKKEPEIGLAAPNKLKILVTIINRSKADFYLNVLEGYDVNLQTVLYGQGTATSDMMNYLGLNDQNKAVILSVVNSNRVNDIAEALEDRYFKTRNGNGVSFTIPISSVIGVMVYQFLSNREVK